MTNENAIGVCDDLLTMAMTKKRKLKKWLHIKISWDEEGNSSGPCHTMLYHPNSSVGRASAVGAGGRNFDPPPRHAKLR